MRITLTATFIATVLAACQPATAPPTEAVVTAPTSHLVRDDWPLPASASAAQPDLIAGSDGAVLLSWIQPTASGHALVFARHAAGKWSAPRRIARGDDWFVNWADTPHIAVTDDGALWAHWLQKSAAATYAYDIALVRSADGGASWSTPVLVNDDGTATEHGFVSMWPATGGALGIAWLDGRATAGGHGHASGAHGGAMSLRAARIDVDLTRSNETRIDAMTCDCCQTDVALTARGPLLVYRDRTPAEIRDIAVTRLDRDSGRWSEAQIVHADLWRMPACPVNGPSVDARGDAVVVAWYTAAGGTPTVKLARSEDAGGSFAPPRVVALGAAVQGRVDVALGRDAVWLLWTHEDADGQSLQLARYSRDLSKPPQRIEVARLQGRGRGTGFAQLLLRGGVAHVVWTDVVDGQPHLRGALLRATHGSA